MDEYTEKDERSYDKSDSPRDVRQPDIPSAMDAMVTRKTNISRLRIANYG